LGRTPIAVACSGEMSEGRTVAANQALAVGNAKLAAQIAVAFKEL